jgi:hypothetical protein
MSSTLSLEHLERRYFRTVSIANSIQIDTEEIREALRLIKSELLISSKRDAPIKIDRIPHEWNRPNAVSSKEPPTLAPTGTMRAPNSPDVDVTVVPSATASVPEKSVEESMPTNTTGVAPKFGQGWGVDFEIDLL